MLGVFVTRAVGFTPSLFLFSFFWEGGGGSVFPVIASLERKDVVFVRAGNFEFDVSPSDKIV